MELCGKAKQDLWRAFGDPPRPCGDRPQERATGSPRLTCSHRGLSPHKAFASPRDDSRTGKPRRPDMPVTPRTRMYNAWSAENIEASVGLSDHKISSLTDDLTPTSSPRKQSIDDMLVTSDAGQLPHWTDDSGVQTGQSFAPLPSAPADRPQDRRREFDQPTATPPPPPPPPPPPLPPSQLPTVRGADTYQGWRQSSRCKPTDTTPHRDGTRYEPATPSSQQSSDEYPGLGVTKVTDGMSPRVTDGMSPRVTDGISPRVTDRISPRVTDGISTRVTDHMSSRVTDGMSPRVADGMSPRVTDGMSPRVTDGMYTRMMTQRITYGMSPRMPAGMSPRVMDDMSPRNTDDMSPRVSNGISPRVTDAMSPLVRDDVSPQMSQSSSDTSQRDVGEESGRADDYDLTTHPACPREDVATFALVGPAPATQPARSETTGYNTGTSLAGQYDSSTRFHNDDSFDSDMSQTTSLSDDTPAFLGQRLVILSPIRTSPAGAQSPRQT